LKKHLSLENATLVHVATDVPAQVLLRADAPEFVPRTSGGLEDDWGSVVFNEREIAAVVPVRRRTPYETRVAEELPVLPVSPTASQVALSLKTPGGAAISNKKGNIAPAPDDRRASQCSAQTAAAEDQTERTTACVTTDFEEDDGAAMKADIEAASHLHNTSYQDSEEDTTGKVCSEYLRNAFVDVPP